MIKKKNSQKKERNNCNIISVHSKINLLQSFKNIKKLKLMKMSIFWKNAGK